MSEGKVIHVGTDMELDAFGSPISPLFPGAQIEVRQAEGLDLSRGGPGLPYTEVCIDANRAGLLQLGYELVAMAHTRPDAEESGFHIHVDELPIPEELQSPGERGFDVTIRIVPSRKQ